MPSILIRNGVLSWALSIFSQPCWGVFMAVLGILIQVNTYAERCPKRNIRQTAGLNKQWFWLNWGLEVSEGHSAHCNLGCFVNAWWADNFGIVLSPVVLLLCQTGSGMQGSKPYVLSHKKPGKLNYANASWAVSASNAGFFFSRAVENFQTTTAARNGTCAMQICVLFVSIFIIYERETGFK